MTNIAPTPEECKQMEKLRKINEKRARKGLPQVILEEQVPDVLFEKTRIPRIVRKILGIKRKIKLPDPRS